MRGIPQIEVTFSIDTNGIVHVTAKDLGTNSQQDITISGSGNMSRDEIDRAVRDAQRYAAEDKQRKQSQQVRDTAENLLNQARRTKKKLKDEDRSRLDGSISALEDALRSGEEYRIRKASDDLDSVLRSVGTFTTAPEGENDDGAYDA